ncbi:hypothetical protein [Winogradskyella sp.]|uniref:hypothetical protein n=1 Tax=Winogradskyella sp. TaxID=1883156 RepID=UPI003AB426F0
MKLFLLKIIKFFLIIVVCYLVLFKLSNYLFVTKYSSVFPAFIIDKYNKVKIKGNEKRLLIIGGSNTIFSIDSELLEKKIGIPVVNLGMVFNTGYEFQQNFIKKYSQNGDIVLYIPEFENYRGEGKYGANVINTALIFKPQLIELFGFKNRINFLKEGFKPLMLPILKYLQADSISSTFNRSHFNSYGDFTYVLHKKSKIKDTPASSYLKNMFLSDTFKNDLNHFYESLESKGVKLFITFPVYSKNFIDKKVMKYADSLVQNNPIFIGNLKENLFEEKLFYDNFYHSLTKARTIYTINLTTYLKDAI